MEASLVIPSSSPRSLFPPQIQPMGGSFRMRIGFLDALIKQRSFRRHRSIRSFGFVQSQVKSSLAPNFHGCKNNLSRSEIGSSPPCGNCQAKGVVLCGTCAGSGLYVDSILESQGITVKVKCLGCGGSGNVLCSACNGRGYAELN